MIEPIISYLKSIIEGMPYFSVVHGLTELKTDAGKLQPVYYAGGKWHRVKHNKLGLAYFRKRQDVTVSQETSRTACRVLYEFNVPLRIFALTKREHFPGNDAYAADRLANTLIKALTFENAANLRSLVRAQRVTSIASLYSTNSQQIISEELSGIDRSDYNFSDVIVAINIDLTIRTNNDCLIDPCDYVPRFCLKLEKYIALP